MAHETVGAPWSLRISQVMYDDLHQHLFPGDGDEHGAVIEAGFAEISGKNVLLARRLWKAEEGVDWVPGKRGYRMMPASYVTKRVRDCRNEQTVYLAVHNHGGNDSVAFSGIDLETHVRGFPALLDIMGGVPVGGLVFAPNAIAGDIWTSDGQRHALSEAVILGPTRRILTAAPHKQEQGVANARFDRQVRLFGQRGQHLLGKAKVVIVGLGGVGILLAEFLGRLGVGEFVLIDPDHVTPSNLPRMTGASGLDAMSWLVAPGRPRWLRNLGTRLATPKVELAKRLIRKANKSAKVTTLRTSVEDGQAVQSLKSADYIFLAADSHRARLLFNAVVNQYMVPGVQVGSRIQSDPETGRVDHVHTVTRWVLPGSGCLVCNQAINGARLQEESVSPSMLKAQKYTDEPDVVAPSVITLNATTASQAANDFLFHYTGLAQPTAFDGYMRIHPLQRRIEMVKPRKNLSCQECGDTEGSRYAKGDAAQLPLIS